MSIYCIVSKMWLFFYSSFLKNKHLNYFMLCLHNTKCLSNIMHNIRGSNNQENLKSERSGLVHRIHGKNPHSSHEQANSQQPVLISTYLPFSSLVPLWQSFLFSQTPLPETLMSAFMFVMSQMSNSPKANITLFTSVGGLESV